MRYPSRVTASELGVAQVVDPLIRGHGPVSCVMSESEGVFCGCEVRWPCCVLPVLYRGLHALCVADTMAYDLTWNVRVVTRFVSRARWRRTRPLRAMSTCDRPLTCAGRLHGSVRGDSAGHHLYLCFPLLCRFLAWKDIVSSLSEAPSVQLMIDKFKRCPKCKMFIEKNHGCTVSCFYRGCSFLLLAVCVLQAAT